MSLLDAPLGRFVLTYMLFVKTLSVLNLVGWKQSKPPCLHSLGWNVWLPGQYDPKHAG